jgi:inosine-uridine nucleoside N-ribohydrolase
MDVQRLPGVAFVALLVVSACGSEASTNAVDPVGAASGSAQVSMVVDYSPTVSDVAALLYLTQQPDGDLLGVTLAGTGGSHCDSGVANTVGLLALVGVSAVPVACGPEDSVGPGHEWPPEWRAAADELACISLPRSDETAPDDAVDLLASLAAAAPEPITIVALGRLTNLAAAIERHPAFADDVAMIYTMGGARSGR